MVNRAGAKDRRGRLYILGVGVDRYPQMPGNDLRYAKADIEAFTGVLQQQSSDQYRELKVTRLADEQATADNILRALNTIISEARPADTLMIYFAGHGAQGMDQRFYFLNTQSDFANLADTALSWQEIAEVLRQSKAKVLVFLDACHSGAASAQDIVVPNDEYARALMASNKAGLVILAASKGRQFSLEGKEFCGGHGAFNCAVTKIFGKEREATDLNKNGLIDLDELYYGMKSRVMEMTEEQQTPWLARKEIIGNAALF
jgi:uncharacterized caspase-like protein